MTDDYANRQAAYERDYVASFDGPEYLRWLEGLSPENRQKAESLGLLKPMIDRSGSTSRDDDASESSAASETPDFAAVIDGESDASYGPMESADERMRDMLRMLIAEVLAQNNTRLTLECLALSCGLPTLQGESMTSIAKRHGITRAAVSKRCVDITAKLNLPPSRSMRSTAARKAYRKVQIKLHQQHERIGHSGR